MTETSTTETPRVWVGCLACYNEGNLVGKWVDADECEDMTPQGAGCRFPSHEESWCFDHEGWAGILDGEVSPNEAAKVWDDIAPLVEWCNMTDVPLSVAAGVYKDTTNGDWDDAAVWVADAYQGCYTSMADYAQATQEDCIPEEDRGPIWLYVDWEAYGRDLMGEYTISEPTWQECHVFYTA